MANTLRDLFNRLKWDRDYHDLDDVVVRILHRGAPDDERSIKGWTIVKVSEGSFDYKGQDGEETTIPYHRVLKVILIGDEDTNLFDRDLLPKNPHAPQ